MLFTSYKFIFIFLPVVLIGFYLVIRIHHKLAALWLCVASLIFYGYWNPKFVLLVLASVTFNYLMGLQLEKCKDSATSKILFSISIAGNLGVLIYFKYGNFFISTMTSLTGLEGTFVNVALPLGISIFTFTQITFLVDVYRGMACRYDFIDYLLFVTYFPHLIAGPILHHKEMLPQISSLGIPKVQIEKLAIGLLVFSIGVGKKVFLADNFAEYASPVFDNAREGIQPAFMIAWAGTLAYTMQLYFDFSGYSDMAIGISLLFGVHLPINFNSPYKSHNIIEFWRRWHMTLSRFLRDYLYIPLGGNRKGRPRQNINIIITMLLGGLWHGASWNFVAWGGLHGIFLLVNHGWDGLKKKLKLPVFPASTLLGRLGGTALTFVAVAIAWIFFRAETWESAIAVLKGCFGINGIDVSIKSAAQLTILYQQLQTAGFQALLTIGSESVSTLVFSDDQIFFLLLGMGFLMIWTFPNTQQITAFFFERKRSTYTLVSLGFLTGILFVVMWGQMHTVSPFIYYQF
ncbi:MAG: alginate O-acetylation protein [Nitrospirales bacterium]|nr:MAG: alginate O-acetylation protein [Nitrospirales bacterium]